MSNRFIILFIIFFVFSCSSLKNTRKIDSNFFAYYNSFYMAEKSFDEAIKEIESMEDVDGDISSKAKKLLEEAVKNSLIIENQFNKTKYLDDAYFILGKSSYLIDRFTSSKYYFNRLINEFPNSEYIKEALIWQSYVDLDVGYIDKVKDDLLLYELDYGMMEESEKYLIDLLFAKVANYESKINEEKKYYTIAIEHSFNKNQKLYLYRKLLSIAENEKKYTDAIACIDYIEKNSDKDISMDMLEKWFLYNRLLGEFDKVLVKINEKIDSATNNPDIIYYNIEKSKTYLDRDDIDKSISVLNEIIAKYNDDDTNKKKLGEVYLLLGEIYLIYLNDIDLAREKFELCKEFSSSSAIYNKQSKKYVESIINFESLSYEIDYHLQQDIEDEEQLNSEDLNNEVISENIQDHNLFMLPMPTNTNDNIEIDSLLFVAAQLLYFDLGMKDLAKVRFKEIIEKFPLTIYEYKSLIALNFDSPNDELNEKINKHPFNLNIFDDTELSIERKKSLGLLSVSPLKALNSLVELNLEHDDSESLYLAGYISEIFLNDLERTILLYREYLNKYNEGEHVSTINLKLSKIENMIKDEINILNQKINYRRGWYWINNGIKVDSAIHYFNLSSNGVEFSLKSHSEMLTSSIEKYIGNKEILENISNNKEEDELDLDSIKLNIADFLYKDINFNNEASKYYRQIVDNSRISNYIHSSLAVLSFIEPKEKWDSTLFSMLDDSALYNIQINNVIKHEPYKIYGTMHSDSMEFSWYNKIKLIFFPEITENTDTGKINEEHNESLEDINNAQ